MSGLPWSQHLVVRRFVSGAAHSLAAAAVGQALPLVAAALLARVLPSATFGGFLFLYGTAATFASLTGYSFGLTATRYVALLASRNPVRAGSVIRQLLNATLGVSFIAAFAGVIAYGWFAPAGVRALGGAWSGFATAVLFCGLAIAGVQAGILGGFQNFSDIGRSNLVRMLVGLPLSVWGGLHFSATGALAGLAAGTIAGCGVNHVQILRACKANSIPLKHRAACSEKSMWTHFSVPSFLAYALVAPVLWLAQTTLLSMPNGLWEVAIFNIALHWRNVIIFVPAAMVQAATPLISELVGAEDRTNSIRVFYLNLAFSGLIAGACAFLVATLGRVVLAAYGQTYTSGWSVLVVMAAGAALAAFNNALGTLIVASGRMWAGFTFNLLWALAVLAQVIPFGRRWGALGLGIAILIAYVLHSAWQSMFIIRARLLPARAQTPVLVTDM